jgi:hypothetical protein
MRFCVTGGVSIQAWCENAKNLQRHFFNSPRRRTMQQADVLAGALSASEKC